MRKQRNTRARAKKKIKLLRAKNLFYRTIERIKKRIQNAQRERPQPVVGEAKKFAIDYHKVFPDGGGGYLFDHNHGRTLNQRQKRKRARQSGRCVK